MPRHIHLHFHDAGTPEGARKAALTRKMHGGGPKLRQNTQQIARAAELNKKGSGGAARTRFEPPKVPVSRTEEVGARREAATTQRRSARQELEHLRAKHKAGKIGGEEYNRFQRLQKMFG